MTPSLPWDWSVRARQRLVLALALVGSALSADAAIRAVLNNDELLNREWSTLSVTISTGMWTFAFVKLMARFRSGWHAAWLGPCLGALNAGTSLSLVYLTSGQGTAEAAQGIIVGTLFGIGMGGGPLGLVFGLVLSLYLAFARPLTQEMQHGPPLRLLALSTAWLLGVATLTLLVHAENGVKARWPSGTLLIFASALAGWTLFEHGRVSRWIRRLQSGRLAHYVLSEQLLPEQLLPEQLLPEQLLPEQRLSGQGANTARAVCWRDRKEDGPFRTSDQLKPLGILPPHALGALSGQALGVFVLFTLPWAILGAQSLAAPMFE